MNTQISEQDIRAIMMAAYIEAISEGEPHHRAIVWARLQAKLANPPTPTITGVTA